MAKSGIPHHKAPVPLKLSRRETAPCCIFELYTTDLEYSYVEGNFLAEYVERRIENRATVEVTEICSVSCRVC